MEERPGEMCFFKCEMSENPTCKNVNQIAQTHFCPAPTSNVKYEKKLEDLILISMKFFVDNLILQKIAGLL